MYARLAEKLASTTAIEWFPGHGAEDDWIVEVEAELGFNLPPSYRWWIYSLDRSISIQRHQ